MDQKRRLGGTRFLLFPQPPFLADFSEPETVWVSSPAGSVGLGPSDDRMYVVDPVDKRLSYGIQQDHLGRNYLYLPPWTGASHPPVCPDRHGHFDYLEPESRAFECAHLFGTVRWVLDIWEDYFDHPIKWHFSRVYNQLELTLLNDWDNAQSGFGFIEVGHFDSEAGIHLPYALNFDILAHEVGHSIIYAEVGVPNPETEEGEYFGFHESAADLVALISLLHFESVVDYLLETSRGNLYTLNRLSRIAELSESEQVRLAANDTRLSSFEYGWFDEHHLAQPLTGAVFDVFIDVFHDRLHEAGYVDWHLIDATQSILAEHGDLEGAQELFDLRYENNHDGFKNALMEARDIVGNWLAQGWTMLTPHFFDYMDVVTVLLDAEKRVTGGRYHQCLVDSFAWREIGMVEVGPRISAVSAKSHTNPSRILVPGMW